MVVSDYHAMSPERAQILSTRLFIVNGLRRSLTLSKTFPSAPSALILTRFPFSCQSGYVYVRFWDHVGLFGNYFAHAGSVFGILDFVVLFESFSEQVDNIR